MEEDSVCNKVENVFGCHVEDAITFWAQSISRHNDILKTRRALAEICPQANSVFGNPDLTKVYGGCFSEDKCWYRCKILKVISDEKCQVLYIDYGNSEVLSRSEIVEIPTNMQFPSVAKRYILWGLKVSAKQDLNQYDQGRKFLNSLIFEKEIKTTIKAICQDGTIIALAECGLLDVGEEIAKKGFAKKCEVPICSSNSDAKMDASPYQSWNAKPSTPVWGGRINPSGCSKAKSGFRENMIWNGSNEKNAVNHIFSKEKVVGSDFRKLPNFSLEKLKQTSNMNEEYEKLKKEKEVIRVKHQNLLRNNEELVSTVKKLSCELEKEKKTAKEANELLENSLSSYVGTKMRSLAMKFQKLREARQEGLSTRFGEDLSEAVQVVTEGCLVTPLSLEKLEKIWMDYNSSQEEIRLCECVEKIQSLISHRNDVQLNLYTVVEEFILEVDDLPLSDRLETLKKLKGSLGDTYGETCEVESSEGVFEKFAEWKKVKLEEFNSVRSATDSSLQNLVTSFSRIVKFFDMTSDVFSKLEDVADNVDEVLKNAELDITQELNIFLTELDEVDNRIILNMYSGVMKRINQEESLLSSIHSKYLKSVEFKRQIVEWLNKSPTIDDLLAIKKRIKNLKAQLRWKLAEKNNLEESDDCSESKMAKIKEEIIALRNKVFEEIYKEQEEYEQLKHLAQKWFPELPLLYPESGIQKYMYSRGLLTVSLEHDLLDAEPMRELSTKRPVVCSEVQGQKVLLKGYAVDMNTETEVIERAAKYHEVQRESKEKSGLMELMFLFLCKSDPLAYLMVPYYARTSLGTLQITAPLTPKEALQVMKGVAHGLHTLHAASIVHGSLHKNNVFAINRERGLVGDFDFTKSEIQRASVNYLNLNGLSLISPEVRQGLPPCPASDMYDYGCLLYWLFIGNQKFKLKQDGTPEIDGLEMDETVKSLLQKLLCCDNRLTSEQVLNDDCFLLLKEIPVALESEPPECENKEGETENENVFSDIPDNETSPDSHNIDLTNFSCT